MKTGLGIAGSIVLLAVAGASHAPAAPASSVRTLRVCADPNNLPFSNEREQGFENELARMIAADLHAELAYTWIPQRRGFVRQGLDARRCDVVMGVPAGYDLVATTTPYYRSGYAFVLGPSAPRVRSLDAPELRRLRIAVPLVGDDGANPPPVFALKERSLVTNIRGYSVFGDYTKDSPAADAVRAVGAGEVDLAIAWGPIAGYWAKRGDRPLDVALIPEGEAPKGLTFTFAIAAGVRRGDASLRDEVDAILLRRRDAIDKLLARYDVPRR